jgi:hypothetical protein
MRNPYKVLIGKLKIRSHLGDKSIEGRAILKQILSEYGVRASTRINWLKISSS